VDRLYPRPNPQAELDSVAAQVLPGFVGEKKIGGWDLICAKTAPAASAQIALGRCRVNFQFHPKAAPQKVLMGVNFRLVGPEKRLTLLLRVPPMVRKDDNLVIGLGHGGLKVPVMNCEQSQCLAGGGLDEAAMSKLIGGARGAVIFPTDAKGKRPSIPFPLLGIRKSIEAMKRAESAVPG